MHDRRAATPPVLPGRFAYPIALLACFSAAGIGSWLTAPHLANWYASLAKPSFNPPNAAFPAVWTVLYAMMAIAVARIATLPRGTPMQGRALIFFVSQLALNVVWSFAFFGRESPPAGMLTVVFLLASVAATTVLFWRIDRPAAYLMLPTVVWVGFAAVLNAAIVALN